MLLSCQHPSTHTPRYQADGLQIKQLLAELSPDKFQERDHKLTQVTETAQDSNIAVIASVATLATYVAGLILYTGSLLVMVPMVVSSGVARSRGRATVQHSSEARQAAEEIIKVLQSRKISEGWLVERET